MVEEPPVSPVELAASSLVRRRLADSSPLALSKCGFSEQAMLVLPPQITAESGLRARALEQTLLLHATNHTGVFPRSIGHVRDVCRRLLHAYATQDIVPHAQGKWTEKAVELLPSSIVSLDYTSLDVRFSSHSHLAQAILDSLSGKHILIITTPADFIAARADRRTFEDVWRKVGRPWFEPASVTPLSFPFVYDPRTHERFIDTFDLFESILHRVEQYEFDVALIGAAVLGPLLAAEIRERGRAAFSIGSQLQLLFGISGSRWADWHSASDSVITDVWTHLPDEFALPPHTPGPEGGAYWR